MEIVDRHSGLSDERRGSVVAIGNYDGVHLGHQVVLRRARAIAGRLGAPLSVLAFEPHPRLFFQPEAPPFLLTPLRAKAHELAVVGVDILFALPFDAEMAGRSADAFIREVLVEGLAAVHVVVGYDFGFGKGRKGNVALLEEYARKYGYGLTVVEPVSHDGEVYSSTLIRQYLEEGKPVRAADLLGHWWKVDTMVEEGDRRGRTIGFPTANLKLNDYLEPAHGVYAVRVELADEPGAPLYPGVANLGRRPTFGGEDVLLEVHIFDFSGELYGRNLRVSFIEYLRPERKFDGIESLKTQIEADSRRARQILADPAYADDRFRAPTFVGP